MDDPGWFVRNGAGYQMAIRCARFWSDETGSHGRAFDPFLDANPRYLDRPLARAAMTTREEAIAIALALPGVEQGSALRNDDFCVRNKIVLAFPQPDRVTIKPSAEHAHALVQSDPETYIPHPDNSVVDGWTRVIPARVDPEALANLVYESWSHVAPKRLRDSLVE
jgi:hypothetical protein